METELKGRENKYKELLDRLDELNGYCGDGVESIVECMGNLITNNVILDRVAAGKTTDYEGAGDVDNNVCTGNVILARIVGILMTYQKIRD